MVPERGLSDKAKDAQLKALILGSVSTEEKKLKKNSRLLSFDSNNVFEETFSLSDSWPGSACKLSYCPICIILLLIVIIVLLPVFNHNLSLASYHSLKEPPKPCHDTCQISIVESIPEGLIFNSTGGRRSTFEAWKELIALAKTNIQLAGMYWTLRGADVYEDPSAWQGEQIFNLLKTATQERRLRLEIAQNQPEPGQPNLDTQELADTVGAEVRSLNFTRLMGAGILHTKLWVVDRQHFYVGSANFDWRSLTQVKEVGLLVKNCACLAQDVAKIWDVYWALGKPGSTVPDSWPADLSTRINAAHPVQLTRPGLAVYLASSPPPFCPLGREEDADAIVKIIDAANVFVRVAVMDYFPATIYGTKTKFWPVIDNAIRRAVVERGVKVELLMSHWAHTRPAMLRFLASLQDLTGLTHNTSIRVKLFKVPAFTPAQARIPFARVNHNKYLVTDRAAYIGTSNWSADYFISTAGIGFVFEGPLREDLVELFRRDWDSEFAQELAVGGPQ